MGSLCKRRLIKSVFLSFIYPCLFSFIYCGSVCLTPPPHCLHVGKKPVRRGLGGRGKRVRGACFFQFSLSCSFSFFYIWYVGVSSWSGLVFFIYVFLGGGVFFCVCFLNEWTIFHMYFFVCLIFCRPVFRVPFHIAHVSFFIIFLIFFFSPDFRVPSSLILPGLIFHFYLYES